MRSAGYVLSLSVLAAACGSSTTGPLGPVDASAVTPTDVAVRADTPAGDAPTMVPTDGSVIPGDSSILPSSDGGVNPVDGAVGLDGGPPPFDVPITPPDVVSPPVDAPSFTLVGRWRVTDYLHTNTDGTTIHLTDVDTTYTDPSSGMTSLVRVNGVMGVGPTRFSLSFGTQAAGHFYINTTALAGDSDFSATGYTLPGLLDDAAGTFTPPGSTTFITFDRNADGTVSVPSTDATGSTVVTFAPANTPPAPLNLLNLLGYVELRTPASSTPFVHPRAAILWDRPTTGAAIETNATPLSIVTGYAPFPLVIAGPPPSGAVGTVAGVSIAVGYTFVYDDVNNNEMYDGAPDVVRGFGPISLVWRGTGTPTADFATSAFAEAVPGYQFAHLQQDLLPAGWTNAVFDTSNVVNPDVPVSATAITGMAPHLVTSP